MNCERFQIDLHEYVEGTLTPRERAAADEHLTRCSTCRQAVQREQQLAQFLGHTFEQHTAPLTLDPNFGQRVVATLASENREKVRAPGERLTRLRLAWRMAIAAGVVGAVIWLGVVLFPAHKLKSEYGQWPDDPTRHSISIQVSLVVPNYTFRREGNFVVDALSFDTNVVTQTLWVENEQPLIHENKTPL